jgi:DNA-binding response OmpR family regulator
MKVLAGSVPERNIDVLFMGTDRALAEMYKLKLELDGYTVQIARPEGDALRRAQEQLPDLIFLDVGQPAAKALKIIEELRADQKTSTIPVIILSGYAEDELTDRGISIGASDYAVKTKPDL